MGLYEWRGFFMDHIDYDRSFGDAQFKSYSEESNPIKITRKNNTTSLFYELEFPLQLTLACCSGTKDDDYVNFYVLSTEKSLFYHETYPVQNGLYHKRPLHYHDFFELTIILEGSIVQKIEDKEYLYHSGSCCFINRTLLHAENFLSKGTILFVGISTPLMAELISPSEQFFSLERAGIQNTDLYHFIRSDLISPGTKSYLDYIPTMQNSNVYPFLHDFSQAMIRAFLSPGYGTTYTIKGLLCSLLSKLSDSAYYHCTQIQLDLNADYLIFSRIGHLLEECDGRMSRKELEETLHYSGDYINRIVKKYTHMCLHDYSMSFCIKKAAVLLATTDESITAISLQLQFSNRTQFYKLFEEAYGMTPKEYRQQSRVSAMYSR